MKYKYLILLSSLLAVLSAGANAAETRTITNFDAGWKFALGDHPEASKVSFVDKTWRSVNLPHDWSIEGENRQDEPAGGAGGFFPTGIGWYRKTFSVPGYSKSKLYSIEFDGVYMNSEVWINGHYLGIYPYGYSSFSYDLTPYLKVRNNVIAVRVDNSVQPNSRWYSGSGIYRHTRLVATGKTRFEKWGVFERTASVDDGKAVLDIESSVISQEKGGFIVRNTLLDADGKTVASVDVPGDINAGDTLVYKTVLDVPDPHLWDLDDPYLYSLVSCIMNGDKELDRVVTPVGIRTIHYDVNKGFFLNGKHVKMYGVNLHHDGGAVGAAVPERVWERRLEILKSSGCNAIRTAHNIPAPEFLDLCDRIGMLVMDESFDAWHWGKNKNDYQIHFDEWHVRDLTCMLKRDRNHPSIVMWSIGNEVPDQSADFGAALAREMIAMCHEFDPSRLVTSGNDRIAADSNPVTPEFIAEFANEIVGYNYPDRWRRRRESVYTEDKLAYPDRMVIGTETDGLGGYRAVGVSMPRRWGANNDVPSTRYIDIEQRWKYTLRNDFVIGDFMWTGIDYYGEAWWPSKGATYGYLDNCGFKKDGYWFFKSIWTSEPVLHLAGGWNYPDSQKGKVQQAVVFTNCDSVSVYVNGKFYGQKSHLFPRWGMQDGWRSPQPKLPRASTADLHLTWDLEYQPGEVVLVGWKNGQEIRETVRTFGEPASVRLTVDRQTIKSLPSDVAHVTAEILDKDGNLVANADNRITFSAPGARIIGVESGNMMDMSSVKSPQRNAFGGMCLAIIQVDKPGSYRVKAEVEGLPVAEVVFLAE